MLPYNIMVKENLKFGKTKREYLYYSPVFVKL